MKVVSFFAGCGGLDLGFEQAGFDVIWANDIEKSVQDTYVKNHPKTTFVLGDMCDIEPSDIPECDGFIGGPPCQSWSVAGKQKGLQDSRGRLFLTYIEMINLKKPKFFLIENVKGLLDLKFKDAFDSFLNCLSRAGYDVFWKLLDAVQYRVPQNRERVFIIGFRKDLNISYQFPVPINSQPISMYRAIGDITAKPRFLSDPKIISQNKDIMNHDVFSGAFGPFYCRGNRRREWDRPSFTIHATGENIPLHPSSPRMLFGGHEKWFFIDELKKDYRRLSVRECARLQTFPDSFEFVGDNILQLYKIVGNAVPPRVGRILALSISGALKYKNHALQNVVPIALPKDLPVLVGYYKSKDHLDAIMKNLLYCVRADGRPGSMYKDSFNISPRYLCLHHNGKASLFELDMDNIFLANFTYLKQLGFAVNGNMYLCFQIKSNEKVCISRFDVQVPDKVQYRNTYSPYISSIEAIARSYQFV